MKKIQSTEERDHAVRQTLLDIYGEDAIHALTHGRSNLEGVNGVHIQGTGLLTFLLQFLDD